MKCILVLLAATCFFTTASAQQGTAATRIFIVRHAEKETGKDPVLTPAGKARAGDLLRALQQEAVQKIYVSQYKRTQMTADSLHLQLNIATVQYTADTLCDNLVNAIMEQGDFGKTILIVAHSNTIPQIIRKLGVRNYPYGDIPDNEFDNLFLITYKNEKARLKKMKYGAASAHSDSMQ